MEKISIIVPVYNSEKYLDRCIDSLINQTYKNLELIFINDGSQDGSIQILKKYAKKDKRIHIIDKKNSGASDSRNKGIDIASGEYICFCDSDDMYELNYIERMYDVIKKENVDIVKCNFKVIDTDNHILHNGNINDISNKKYNNEEIKNVILPKCLTGEIPCFCYLIMIKRSTLINRFPIKIRMMEDVIFYLELLINTKSMYIINDSLYTIMYNPTGITNNVNNTKKNILDVMDVNLYIKSILKDNNLDNSSLYSKININTLNSISDFIFKYYLSGRKDTLNICKEINNATYLTLVNETNLKLINLQRRIILKLIKNKNYLLLNIYMFIRKIIFKLRRIIK